MLIQQNQQLTAGLQQYRHTVKTLKARVRAKEAEVAGARAAASVVDRCVETVSAWRCGSGAVAGWRGLEVWTDVVVVVVTVVVVVAGPVGSGIMWVVVEGG